MNKSTKGQETKNAELRKGKEMEKMSLKKRLLGIKKEQEGENRELSDFPFYYLYVVDTHKKDKTWDSGYNQLLFFIEDDNKNITYIGESDCLHFYNKLNVHDFGIDYIEDDVMRFWLKTGGEICTANYLNILCGQLTFTERGSKT
jgi:hypothetical protein